MDSSGKSAAWTRWIGVVASIVTILAFVFDVFGVGSLASKKFSLTPSELYLWMTIVALIGTVVWREFGRNQELSQVRSKLNEENSRLRREHDFTVVNYQSAIRRHEKGFYHLSQKMRKVITDTSNIVAGSSVAFLEAYFKINRVEARYAERMPKTNDLVGLNNLKEGHSDSTGTTLDTICRDFATDVRKAAMSYLAAIGKKEQCRVVVKILNANSSSLEDMSNWTYTDSFWDKETAREIDDDVKMRGVAKHPVGSYGPLRDICDKSMPYFACDDLRKLVSENPRSFTTPSQNWRERYNAKVIVPIEYSDPRWGFRVVYGFISIDSPNKSGSAAFSGSKGDKFIINLAKTSSSLLCAILNQLERSGVSFEAAHQDRLGSIRGGRRVNDSKPKSERG